MRKISIYLCLFLVTLLSACGGDDGLGTTDESTLPDQDQDGTALTLDSNYVYKLPVIFHVLYQDASDESQYISATRLKNILQYVNEIYKGGTYGESANMHVEFVLAETDESGNKLSTPGVEYVKYTGEYPIDPMTFLTDNSGKYTKYIWDPNDYINVVLFNFKRSDTAGGVTLGVSHMPVSVDDSTALEGLETTSLRYIPKSSLHYAYCSVINSQYAGRDEQGGYYQSSRYTNGIANGFTISPSDIVVTIAHELGHYLGLFHIFTEDAKSEDTAPLDSCGDTDYCKDTPSYNRKEYEDYLAQYTSSQSSQSKADDVILRHACDGTDFYSANTMDYAYTLGYKISDNQKERMRHVLYYSPLIPGPKRNKVNVRTRGTREVDTPLDFWPVVIR